MKPIKNFMHQAKNDVNKSLFNGDLFHLEDLTIVKCSKCNEVLKPVLESQAYDEINYYVHECKCESK